MLLVAVVVGVVVVDVVVVVTVVGGAATWPRSERVAVAAGAVAMSAVVTWAALAVSTNCRVASGLEREMRKVAGA